MVFKCVLFMGVGIIDYEFGICDICLLNGMCKVFFKMYIVMLFVVLFMVGVFFLNGFLSKEMFLDLLIKVNEFD